MKVAQKALHFFHATISNHLSEKPKICLLKNIWSLNTGLTVPPTTAIGPDGLSTREGQKPSPGEGVQPDLQPRDPRHRKKTLVSSPMLVSSTMFTSPCPSTVTSLPEGVSSVPEGVELTRALSPVVNLGPLTAEIDFALQQVNMSPTWYV